MALKRNVPPTRRHTSKNARNEWRKLAPLAHANGRLTMNDARSFAQLCEYLAIATEAREAVERHGLTLETDSGGEKGNPAVQVCLQANIAAERLMRLFALDPAGRAEVERERAITQFL